MTANQRRPGFRLPWSSDADAREDEPAPSAAIEQTAAGDADPASEQPEAPAQEKEAAVTPPATPQAAANPADHAEPEDAAAEPAGSDATATSVDQAAPAASTASGAAATDFMRDLVAAMRKVADEARQTGLDELRSRAEEQVRKIEEDAGRRADDLRARAEADVAGVGEWAKAEAERIKAEAEARVVARRAQLEQQLAGETSRTEAEAKAVRERVAEYERELEAYHAQLAAISDPAAFAAAAKRMPGPPKLGNGAASGAASPSPTVTAEPQVPVQPAAGAEANGKAGPGAGVHPAEEEVLAGRLAELDATLPADESGTAAAAPSEPATTEVVVKGLGSFGAITGFRQALSGVDGIDGVALSLGQTGEFVFKATHAAGFDLRGAIAKLEGDQAKIEDRPEGGLRVTLEKNR